MTNLDPNFANLPTPKPKRSAPFVVKKWIRRAGLQLVGGVSRNAPTCPGNVPRKILLIRPDHLGDLLFLTPAIRYLRSLLPKAQLTLMAGPWGEEIMRNNPHLDEILSCEFPGFTRQPKPSVWQPYRYLREQAELLRSHSFDQAVILRFDHWWGAWLAAAAGIPQRLGYAIPEVTPFLTDAIPYNSQRHEAEQNWRLAHLAWSRGTLPVVESWSDADTIGPLEFFISPEDRAWAEEWLFNNLPDGGTQKRGADSQPSAVSRQPLVIIHPGAGAAVKLWREEAWAELAQSLSRDHNCQIVFSGGPAERELCQAIAGQISPPPVLAGQTTLGQLTALMSRASLIIGPDTGPLKLAAAVGAPTLQLYGPVDPIKFGPWGDAGKHRVIKADLSCAPCNMLDYSAEETEAHFCVRGLSAQSALRAAIELIK